MSPYMALTSNIWFENIVLTPPEKEINFWRKSTNNFRSLYEGDEFFFVEKQFKNKLLRQVIGKANFCRFEKLTINDAWLKYGVNNGVKDLDTFQNTFRALYKIQDNSTQIGCIVLTNLEKFVSPVLLDAAGISMHPNIISGKYISAREAKKISLLSHSNY